MKISRALLLLVLLAALPLHAQQSEVEQAREAALEAAASDPVNDGASGNLDDAATGTGSDVATGRVDSERRDVAEVLTRLEDVQTLLDEKIRQRSELGEAIEQANEQDAVDLRRRASEISEDIDELRDTLESIAIGGTDDSLFRSTPEPDQQRDWREDIAMIAQPVIDSLKDLTEKPRRIAELNEAIKSSNEQIAVAEQALANIVPVSQASDQPELRRQLERLRAKWQERKSDAESAIRLAEIQLAELQGDQSFFESAIESVGEFLRGRGLTLLMALAAAAAVFYGLRFLMKRYRQMLLDRSNDESRTRYRLAEYTMHGLTGVLILAAVFAVFYQRGDVLLLGLLILLLFGLALGVRTLLPRYFTEARLLLNIGSMREGERIIYRDLPWRVESINMYTILRNPELSGVLRVPLADLHGVHSRPAANERWFPTAKGDVILLDGELLEVLAQNPDTVEVQEKGGQLRNYRTTEFYGLSMTNISRSGSFGVKSVFGVDYDLQHISTGEIPKKLRASIRAALEASDVGEFIKDVQVELQAAGSSSIDYWILVTMHSRAAKSWPKIGRIIQSACVECCTREGWNIPFPHLSVVQKTGGEALAPG